MAKDDRRMTFIVIPHGGFADMSTRSWELSYRKLRVGLFVGVAVHHLLLAVPKGGELAALQGYLKEENPFKPGTARHAAWIRKFDQGVATLTSDG